VTRGARVIVIGRPCQRSYENKEGDMRTVYELEVDDVGVSLRNATVRVWKASRASAGHGGRSRPNPASANGFANETRRDGADDARHRRRLSKSSAWST
jgi:single-strand DNA-binding protein